MPAPSARRRSRWRPGHAGTDDRVCTRRGDPCRPKKRKSGGDCALADDCCAAIEAYGGPVALSAGIEAGELTALAVVAAVDVRAGQLGATADDLIAALRAAGIRRGILPTIH